MLKMKFHEISMRPAFNSNSYLFPGALFETPKTPKTLKTLKTPKTPKTPKTLKTKAAFFSFKSVVFHDSTSKSTVYGADFARF